MAYTIKAAKQKKRGKGARVLPQELCGEAHCPSLLGHCSKSSCKDLLHSRLHGLKNENLSLSLAYDFRQEAAKKLEGEMDVDDLASADLLSYIEASAAMRTNNAVKAATTAKCSCTSCGIQVERAENEDWRKKLAGVETKMDVLREHKAANDNEGVKRDVNNFGKGKYFTRSGTYRGNGAIALKPKLQMQNSYDVAALTKNTMATRAIKTAAGEKPRPAPAEAATAQSTEHARKERLLQKLRQLGLHITGADLDKVHFYDEDDDGDGGTDKDSDEYSSDEYVTSDDEDAL